jgi:3'-5' exonuclease
MNYKSLFYFDIETVSNYKSLKEFEDNDKRGYELFLRKIRRKSDNFKDWKEPSPEVVYENKSCLIPEFGKIVCMSFAFYKNDELSLSSLYGDDEENLIQSIHRLIENISDKTSYGLCGYYIKGFDIPWLIRKMLKYDLKIPNLLKTFNVKPWEMNVIDLAEVWRSNGTLETTSFDEMLYELGVDSPKDDISGEDVNRVYWQENNLLKIKDYCEKDVQACVNTMKKISLIL